MQIFKFGGASVKNAEAIKNLCKILQHKIDKQTLVVVSAMGKTTNAFEEVVSHYLKNNSKLHESISQIKTYHFDILNALFNDKNHFIYSDLEALFEELSQFLKSNKSLTYNYVYDQVIAYGELISTTIISAYLNENKISNQWLDARKVIKTNSNYRDAVVNWQHTQSLITNYVMYSNVVVTQGFIASDSNNFTTTLGREGSDYTAAIFAYCLNASHVTIWKDVPGVLSADPKVFEAPVLLEQITYNEAIELAFYGASVIHPKTIQPLQRKEISLFVKSFLDPNSNGTIIAKGEALVPKTTCYIVKNNLFYLELSSLDFSFIVEQNVSYIFKLLHDFDMKVWLMQNSAISFSVCISDQNDKFDELLLNLKAKFKIEVNKNVSLYTIKHYTKASLVNFERHNKVLLKQIHQDTFQAVVK